MFPQRSPTEATVDSKTYPLGEKSVPTDPGNALAVVSLSHTAVEQRLYSAMLSAPEVPSSANGFTARNLMDLTGIRSLSTIRRGLEGLVAKLSIAKDDRENGKSKREAASCYRVFQPTEVIARRKENGEPVPNLSSGSGNHSFEKALVRIIENARLSRREAQVALRCAEGLTNAEIGRKLDVSEQTVKFHMRHIFIKFGVKRRTELISRLLT
jgi:DNA-binding CsgD family transcriptional regulator